MLPQRKQQQSNPYSWQAGDTSTFSQQAQNLGEQVGDQGLNTNQIDVQKQTADAQQKAGETGQNVAQGAGDVAKGAGVDPTVAQAGTPGSPQVQPYKVTTFAPLGPNTQVKNNTDFSQNSTYEDPTQKYLNSIFPDGIPSSVQNALDAAYKDLGNQKDPTTYQGGNIGNGAYLPTVTDQGYNPSSTGISDAFGNYLNYLNQYQQGQANNSVDEQSYENALGNQLQQQIQKLDQQYQTGQTDLAAQNTAKQKAISDYINQLQTGLKNYQTNTQDLSNTGQLSEAEQASAAENGVLAGPNVSGIAALNALSQGGSTDTRLAALSQQAQNAAIQQAEGKAGAIQAQAQNAAQIQAAGQKAQNQAYTDAGTKITKNQENQFNRLKDSSDTAQQALADAYNKSKTNLTNQEQDYVNKAQDTLKNSKISPDTVKSATSTFVNTVDNYVKNNKLSDADKRNLLTQIESIWRIAVGSNPNGANDIKYSDDISNILNPLAQDLNGQNFTPVETTYR